MKMEQKEKKIKHKFENNITDFGEGMLILGIVLLVIFFLGEPDLHDALIKFLMQSCLG